MVWKLDFEKYFQTLVLEESWNKSGKKVCSSETLNWVLWSLTILETRLCLIVVNALVSNMEEEKEEQGDREEQEEPEEEEQEEETAFFTT